jgi:cytochrome c-type biogenesis protein CcmH/NrfG
LRRSFALIAVGIAVAVAGVIVVAGMTSGDGGEASGAAAGAGGTATGSLPSGHPSIAPEGEPTAAPSTEPDAGGTIARLEKQRAKDPTDVNVLLDLGEAYFLGQRLQQAERVYNEAIAQEPDNAAAQVGRAMVWHAQGDSKRAATALRAVLKAHPDDQAAHYTLAIVYFSSGRLGEAKAEWQTAAKVDPSSTTGKRSQSFVDLLEDQASAAPAAEADEE